MTQERLQNIRHLNIEIANLQREIGNPLMVRDSVKGSRTDPPYDLHMILIEGLEQGEKSHLKRKLERKLTELQDELCDMEDWLDEVADSEMRTILRLRYRNGLSWQRIAFEIGAFDEGVPRKKVNRFLRTSEISEKSVVI